MSAPLYFAELELELLGSTFYVQSWSWSLKALEVKLEPAPNWSQLSISVFNQKSILCIISKCRGGGDKRTAQIIDSIEAGCVKIPKKNMIIIPFQTGRGKVNLEEFCDFANRKAVNLGEEEKEEDGRLKGISK